MTFEFNEQELNRINEEASQAEEIIEEISEEASQAEEIIEEISEEASQVEEADHTDPIQTSLTTFKTMTVDQSIYATVEPGTAPLLRSSTTTDNAKLFNALNGSSESVKKWLDEEVDVVDIIITSADVPSVMGDEESERVCKPCVHFYTLDGTHISSISNGIIKATKMLLACGLAPTEDNPIRIRFKEIETKKGTAHTFDMV